MCGCLLENGWNFGILVNIFFNNLWELDFLCYVQCLMSSFFEYQGWIIFEVIEIFMMQDFVNFLNVLCLLYDNGIFVLIDDFGFGYLLLFYIKQLLVNEIKID